MTNNIFFNTEPTQHLLNQSQIGVDLTYLRKFQVAHVKAAEKLAECQKYLSAMKKTSGYLHEL